jgi:hypothetical protein
VSSNIDCGDNSHDLEISFTENWGHLGDAEKRTNAEIQKLVVELAMESCERRKEELRKEISKLNRDALWFRRAKRAELPIIKVKL